MDTTNWLMLERARNPVPELPALLRRYADAEFTRLPAWLAQPVWDYLERFWELGATGSGMMLVGLPRTGKTYAAHVLIKLIGTQVAAGYVDAEQLMTWGDRKFTADAQQQLAAACAVPFLVVDDFTALGPKSDGWRYAEHLLATRFDRLLPTVWTGNVPEHGGQPLMDWIGKQYGKRVQRRFEDTCMYVATTGYEE